MENPLRTPLRSSSSIIKLLHVATENDPFELNKYTNNAHKLDTNLIKTQHNQLLFI